MTPIQSQALDLLARIFIWTVRIAVLMFGMMAFFGIIGILTK